MMVQIRMHLPLPQRMRCHDDDDVLLIPESRAAGVHSSQEVNEDDDFVNPPKSKYTTRSSVATSSKAGKGQVKGGRGKATSPVVEEGGSSSCSDEELDEESEDELQKEGYYLTTRCSPGSVVHNLQNMPQNMKTRISELGFGDLLKFSCSGIGDRGLAMYLMNHVKDNPLRLEVRGNIFPITPEVVHAVTGIPLGPKDLPTTTYQQRQQALSELRSLCDDKGMEQIFEEFAKKQAEGVDDMKGAKKNGGEKSKTYASLGKKDVPRWIIEEFASKKDEVVDDWTIQCFFMLVFNALMFPTTTTLITGLDYLLCKNLDEMKKFNWCKALVSDFSDKAAKWRKSIGKGNVKSPSVQGCIAFQ